MLTAVCLGVGLAATACSGGSPAAKSTPSPSATKPAAVPTKPAPAAKRTAGQVLRELATAEETYQVDKSAYVAFTGRVPAAFGVAVPAEFKAGAALIGTSGYCIALYVPARQSFAFYDSTKGGIVPGSAKPGDLTPACVAEARKLVA